LALYDVASNNRQALDVAGMAGGGRGSADDASTKMVDDDTGKLQVHTCRP
jgi:hypothetical protein